MSQILISLGEGRENVVTNTAALPGTFLSSQYSSVYKLDPLPTEWVPGGKPIYNRLPGVSERYRKDFPFDDNVAYVYVPPQVSQSGQISMKVEASGENKFIVIQGGTIVWKYGAIPTDPVIVDLEQVGIGSAKYLIAYQLYYDDSPVKAQYEVSDFNLNGYRMDIRSNTDSVVGWRYTPDLAFLQSGSVYWGNYDGKFPAYSQEAVLSWQLPLPAAFSKITLRCPLNTVYTGTATLYYATCPDPGAEFCEYPDWTFVNTVEVSKDTESQYFEFNIETPVNCKGWKVVWTDDKMSIRSILVSGVLTLEKKPAAFQTKYALVAYPLNSIPTKFINGEGQEVPLILCELAYVDIDDSFQILKIQDRRQIVLTSYEPVAEWLTRFWDSNLTHLFDSYSDFSKNWMNPVSSMRQEYDQLGGEGIVVDYGVCPNPPTQESL